MHLTRGGLPDSTAEGGTMWGEEEGGAGTIEAVRRKGLAVRGLALFYAVWLHNIRDGIRKSTLHILALTN